IKDEYYRERRHDIVDVGKKLLYHLSGTVRSTLADLHEEAVVVAHNLLPSDTFALPEQFIHGLATDIGGRTSHTAILAQSLEIPAVVGLKDLTTRVNTGDLLIIDGHEGLIIIHPDQFTVENYRREREIQRAEGRALEKLRDLPAQTHDGHRIHLAANIEIPDEVRGVLHHGAEGIGLYRTEFLYLNRDTLPTEEEHYQAYRQVAQSVLPYSVVLRTVDIGGDKLAAFDVGRSADEANPFLGLRGIRLCLRYPGIFKTQLAGILRASVEGKLKMMYPMVSSVEELRQANAILQEVKRELKTKGVPFADPLEVGVMIEVPSAALIADLLAQEADFLSLGTNDLIQYTLAVDRVNENVASLYDPLHLGVLRLVRSVIEAGHRAGKWVGMCGEMAGDPLFTPILVGLGLAEFSVPPAAVPRIKQAMRAVTHAEAKALAQEVLAMTEHEAVMKRLRARSG
ncbi:MAG: phosphoenolpyruvate--protein phosphotransferase, partial [Elusimicrobia bacterium]|nr:phosphoenolpyruvate--protein phosphotransferase [Elusimicrobiota bacterium]